MAARSRQPEGIDAEEINEWEFEEEGLKIAWKPNRLDQTRLSRFQWIWLRDNCTCPLCLDPSTQQKLRRTVDIPRHLHPGHGNYSFDTKVLTVKWDDHTSTYPLDYLYRLSHPDIVAAVHNDPPKVRPWTKAHLPESMFPFEHMRDGKSRGLTLGHLLKYGIVFLTGVPAHSDGILEVAETFGTIHDTFYGRTWDVRSVQDSKNIAYTDKDLGFHQDLLYMESPPAYQILHCIKNEVEGGTSSFVDGFMAANTLFSRRSQTFKQLLRWHIPFQYVNDGHEYYASHPTIRTGGEDGDVTEINWSPPFQGPFPIRWQPPVYNSLIRFSMILKEPIMQFRHRMNDGDCVIFNNRRILHARDQFDGGSGERWLKGCYLEPNQVVTNWRKYGDHFEFERQYPYKRPYVLTEPTPRFDQ